MHYTRAELSAIVAARHGQRETQGEHAFLEFRIKATPELLEHLIGGYWTTPDGRVSRLDGLDVDDDGYVIPIFTSISQAPR